jgi:hypothetical protein
MRRGKGAGKGGNDGPEPKGGHAMSRLHQLQRERGLPETDADSDSADEPGGAKPQDCE